MPGARAFESSRESVPDRGTKPVAPRSTPLALVNGAVAGDDLQGLAAAAAQAIGCPVAIAIPSLGETVVSPLGAFSAEELSAVRVRAAAAMELGSVDRDEVVGVRIGQQVLGVVATAVGGEGAAERRAWLEAAAAAASVAALVGADRGAARDESAAELLSRLAAGAVDELPALLERARRLGVELEGGGIAVCAQVTGENGPRRLASRPGTLLAEFTGRRVFGLVGLQEEDADELAELLRGHGMTVARSAPRLDPGSLPEALREAELLVELAVAADVPQAGRDETYRLLIGVLLRDPDELVTLRDRTIASLTEYDARHDADLLQTLKTFLDHHGSTTETADAMQLHRHTVGYRLSRVHDVSDLSPYESDGRERLSLGLKAHQILEAQRRLAGVAPLVGDGAEPTGSRAHTG